MFKNNSLIMYDIMNYMFKNNSLIMCFRLVFDNEILVQILSLISLSRLPTTNSVK